MNQTFNSFIIEVFMASCRVVGEGRYAQTQTGHTHKPFKVHTFAFILQLIFIPTAVYKAVFTSKPGCQSYFLTHL